MALKTDKIQLTALSGTGSALKLDADGNVYKGAGEGTLERNLGGAITKETPNSVYTYLGELIIEKATTTTFLISVNMDAGNGELSLYNYTNHVPIATIFIININKEIKSGTINNNDLLAGNNIIELWGKATGGNIYVNSFQIRTI